MVISFPKLNKLVLVLRLSFFVSVFQDVLSPLQAGILNFDKFYIHIRLELIKIKF